MNDSNSLKINNDVYLKTELLFLMRQIYSGFFN